MPPNAFSASLSFLLLTFSPLNSNPHDSQDVKRTRISGLAALEDAQAALAGLHALVVYDDNNDGENGNDHRRHPAVLRLLSQCPFPQLASYVATGAAGRIKSASCAVSVEW